MKQQSEATIQFSGYPLSVVEAKKKIIKDELVVVKPLIDTQTPIQKNTLANDPASWDVDWFNSYE